MVVASRIGAKVGIDTVENVRHALKGRTANVADEVFHDFVVDIVLGLNLVLEKGVDFYLSPHRIVDVFKADHNVGHFAWRKGTLNFP